MRNSVSVPYAWDSLDKRILEEKAALVMSLSPEDIKNTVIRNCNDYLGFDFTESHIIVIELAKLEQIAQKPVEEMTALERWAVFFRYTPDKDKRELVNEIIESEEGIAMAGQVLLHISKDERERARLTSEYKYAVD